MIIEIGLRNNTTQLTLDTDLDAQALNEFLSANNGQPLSLTDKDGMTYLIPADSVAYIRVGQPPQRRVGFGF